jgi:aminopeptidase N
MASMLKKLLLVSALLSLSLALATAASAAKGKPKLSVAKVNAPPSSVEPGDDFKVRGKLRNKGKADFGGSGDGLVIELRGAGIEPTEIGEGKVPKVKARSKKSFAVGVTVPGSLGGPQDVGPLSLFACVGRQGDKGKEKCKRSKGSVTVRGTNPPPETNFTPGARTLGDPLFPQIGNGGYDARHYAMELDYDPATNSFAPGTGTTITARATQDLSEFSFDFQDDLTVSAVTVNGTPATFQQVDAIPVFSSNPAVTQPKKLVVTPAAGITNGSQFVVHVAYSGTPAEITDADESFEGWVRSCQTVGFTPPCDGSYTVNEPIGAQSWYPNNNYPQDKATFEQKITVPSTHVALGVGELDRRTDNGDGTRTWEWAEDDPTGTFLVSGTVGLFDYSNDSSFTEDVTGRNLPIYKAIDSAKNATAKNTFATNTAEIPAVMNFFADRYGPYPFDSTGAVTDIAPDVGYALENQTKPHYATSLTSNGVGFSASTQAHELSHQWFGDAVSPNTWEQIWFSEGWATYSEVAIEETPPTDTTEREAFFDAIYSEVDLPDPAEDEWSIPPAELGGPENLFAGFPVYDRPGAMIEGFRQILGDDDAFYEFARGIQEDYRYGTISEEQFVDAATEASGFTGAELTLLEDYFQQWLHSDSKPTITPDDFVAP